MSPKRLTCYGHFGAGNLGNECTLQVVIEELLQRWPEAKLQCVCADPADVQARHHVQAVRATVRTAEWSSGHVAREDPTAPKHEAERPPSPGRARTLMRSLLKPVRIAFHRLPIEVLHWLRGIRTLARTEMLIVPGTGIVSDYLTGPFGWPYDIFKWSTLAAVCRVRLVFLSVGIGPVHHPISRWLIRTSLRLAHYRSYRDEASRQYLERMGFSTDGDPVYPDLVFGLSPRHLEVEARNPAGRRVVGLGLKDYAEGAGGAEAESHRNYLAAMADFVAWLQQHGYEVRLLIGDLQYDVGTRRELLAILRERRVAVHSPMLVAEDPFSVRELVQQIGQTDIVVSPRFHNLVLGLMLGKPVIALSDHAKLDSLLTDLDLAQYRVPLEKMRSDVLVERFGQLENNAQQLKTLMKQRIERYRGALLEQYDLVFPVIQASRADKARLNDRQDGGVSRSHFRG